MMTTRGRGHAARPVRVTVRSGAWLLFSGLALAGCSRGTPFSPDAGGSPASELRVEGNYVGSWTFRLMVAATGQSSECITEGAMVLDAGNDGAFSGVFAVDGAPDCMSASLSGDVLEGSLNPDGAVEFGLRVTETGQNTVPSEDIFAVLVQGNACVVVSSGGMVGQATAEGITAVAEAEINCVGQPLHAELALVMER